LHENQATHSSSLQDSLVYLSTFVSFSSDLGELLSSECLDRSQSVTLAEAKVRRLELYHGGNSSGGGNPMMPAYQQANRERDELRERYEGEREECRQVKEEMARLEEEMQMISRMQANENAEMS
jgi:hypothetical protein